MPGKDEEILESSGLSPAESTGAGGDLAGAGVKGEEYEWPRRVCIDGGRSGR
jgi:hypothetical protein